MHRTPSEAARSQSGARRLRSLDGLRGVAALVVVIHHSLLAVPGLAAAYYTDTEPNRVGTVAWWLSNTPLHLVWAGTEAVVLFFVLSGLVLTIPALRPGFSWVDYYPRRIVRLYLPVAAAVAFGCALALVVHRTPDLFESAWLQNRAADVRPGGALRDLVLLAGPSNLISPLWSLQWEVAFSLALPLFVWFAVRGRAPWAVRVGAVVVVVAAGAALDFAPAIWLPMFALGALGARHLPELNHLAQRLRPAALAGIGVLGLVLLTARWSLRPLHLSWTDVVATPVALVGGALVVFAAAYSPGARRALETRLT